MKNHASWTSKKPQPKFSLPNKNSKRAGKRQNRSRGGPRSKSGPTSVSARGDKSELGFANSFVPALSRPKFRGRLRYGAASLNFTSTTGLVARYVFTANGLFDPNITGGALSPAGFAQLITSYDHYVVTHSRITVIFTNNSTTPTLCGIALESTSTGSSDPNNMLEMPYEQVIQLEGAGSYGSSKTLSMSCNLSKYFGENVAKTSGIYRGDAVSNPTEQCYFHCLSYGLKGGSSDMFMTVKIEYTAMFLEPRELSPSLTAKMLALVVDEAKTEKTDELVIVTNSRAQVVKPHK